MNKIRKNNDFQKAYNKGKKYHSKYIILFRNKNNDSIKRFGFVTSKKMGNAVQRNRMRRLLREVVRLNLDFFEENYDYVFVAKSMVKDHILTLTYQKLQKDIKKMVIK